MRDFLTFRPLLKHDFRYFASWFWWTEEELFRFAADQDQAQVYLRRYKGNIC